MSWVGGMTYITRTPQDLAVNTMEVNSEPAGYAQDIPMSSIPSSAITWGHCGLAFCKSQLHPRNHTYMYSKLHMWHNYKNAVPLCVMYNKPTALPTAVLLNAKFSFTSENVNRFNGKFCGHIPAHHISFAFYLLFKLYFASFCFIFRHTSKTDHIFSGSTMFTQNKLCIVPLSRISMELVKLHS